MSYYKHNGMQRTWPNMKERTLQTTWLVKIMKEENIMRPMMDYACPVWRAAARSHIKKLQVLQSKCLRIATNAPWYSGNRQIHDDLGVPYFSDHIRFLTERIDLKLVGKQLVEQLDKHLRWPSVDLRALIRGTQNRHPVMVTQTEVFRDFRQL
jgi:hypothetical protein